MRSRALHSPRATHLADEFSIPATAVFDDTPLRWIVDVDNAKALAKAPRPFKVVQQRPQEIALDLGPQLDRVCDGLDMAMQVLDTIGVRHTVGTVPGVRVGRTVFGDEQRYRAVV